MQPNPMQMNSMPMQVIIIKQWLLILLYIKIIYVLDSNTDSATNSSSAAYSTSWSPTITTNAANATNAGIGVDYFKLIWSKF